jgi:thiol:disulfide interchange protein DsbC
MIKKYLSTLVGTFAVSCVTASFAAEGPVPGAAKPQSPEATITAKLEQAIPQYKITSVRPSPVDGLYLVKIGGNDILVTADGSKFIQGEIFNIEGKGISKWEDPAMAAERKKALATLDPKDSIIFKPAGKTKAVVYVFTDVDCGYCRKLNHEMTAYNNLGIEIRYLAFPRAGIPSESASKLETAWCSKDKQKALTALKEEKQVPSMKCENNPIAKEFALGAQIGVNATPALWMPNGEIKLGYLPPEQLAKELGIL